MKTWSLITIVSKSTQVLPRLYTRHHALIPKRRGSGNLTTHVLSSADPGVHVLQIDLTPTNTSTSPKLVHALLIFLILNDSKTDRHNNTTMTQHTSPVLYSTLMRFEEKRSSCILFTEYTHPRRYKRFLQQIHKKKRSPKVPRFLASSLSRPSILLQQKLNYPSDAAEDH
jgi:hypothetical protein